MTGLCGRAAVIAVLLSLAAGARLKVTPVEKVISLLDDLKATIEKEGKAESSEYDKFACFCQSSTAGRSTSILEFKEQAEILSSSIAEDTASKATKSDELGKRKTTHEEMEAELASTKDQYAKDETQYKLDEADLSKAIYSLEGAMTALKGAKSMMPVLISLRESAKKGSDFARALDAKLPKSKVLLQAKVDPNSPEYKYHSDGIVSTLEELNNEFTAKKTSLDSEWTKTKSAAEATIQALDSDISNNDAAMSGLTTSIEKLTMDIAAHTEGIVAVQAMLKDDKLYLADLTERCEARAKDWDQRSKMRGDELAAIAEASAIIVGRVQGMDVAVNKRALLQGKQTARPAAAAPAFVQLASVHGHGKQAAANNANATQELTEEERAAVLDLISKEGSRLKSQSLSMLAMKLAGDPFAKVKDLIQTLIERLLAESTSEASKEGFCNTELGKAKKDREFRYKEVRTLNVEIKGLELKKDELESEIMELTDSIEKLGEDLKTSTALREEEHVMNMDTLGKAKEGLEALTEAIVVLKAFYAKGASAVSLVQASPVDEDTTGPGFSGNYGGKQSASKGIIGMLNVIKTDFQRTIETTTNSEKTAQSEFVEFDRVSRTDISGKTQKKELDEQDLESTIAALGEGMSSLQTEMNLLDTAIIRLEELKPFCTDFGMSYADRVAKREAEIDALKRAICALGGSDPTC